MPFQQDVAYADEVGESYGKYHSTFRSETGQVLALLFEQNGRLVAHVFIPSRRQAGGRGRCLLERIAAVRQGAGV